jgi:hypothetical protein
MIWQQRKLVHSSTPADVQSLRRRFAGWKEQLEWHRVSMWSVWMGHLPSWDLRKVGKLAIVGLAKEEAMMLGE